MIRNPLVLPDLMLQMYSPNRNEIAGQISTAPGAAVDLPSAMRCVFVCFTNRCGSAYLGDILSATGFFGQPLETLNAATTLPYCKEHGLRSYAAYFGPTARRDARNDTFIVKVMPEQLLLLCETGILDQIMPRSTFLFMQRTDKLAQAISRTIAQQNNRWAWDSPIGLPDDKLVYATDRITQNLQDVMLLNRSFEQFFSLNGIMPIMVEYERLVEAPQQELDRIARLMGLDGLQIDASRLRYRRQANEINQAWAARYLSERSPPLGSSVGNTMLRRGDRPVLASVITARIVAHVRNVGDVVGTSGAWVGTPGDGRWIEGYSITPREGIEPDDIEYLGITDFGATQQWVTGGTFCGTRGHSAPLLGIGVRLGPAASARYGCVYSVRFVDGTEIGPVAAGQISQAGSGAPLEAFQVLITRHG